MRSVDPSKNAQKQRKANDNHDERQSVYWDLKGKYQEEYDKRLDALPPYGKGATKASEIFRAATKLYYDFYNNAMVNNTSGACNFLLYAGVFPSQQDNDFALIHSYTTGAKIYINEIDLPLTMERMLDRTIAFLRANAELDALPNDVDYLEFTQQCEKEAIDRCAIRNIKALTMKGEVKSVAVVEEQEAENSMVKHRSTAQDCYKKKKKEGAFRNITNTFYGISSISVSKK